MDAARCTDNLCRQRGWDKQAGIQEEARYSVHGECSGTGTRRIGVWALLRTVDDGSFPQDGRMDAADNVGGR